MTILRKCPVCRSTVSSGDSTHCPECGAVLDQEYSAAETIAVDALSKKVKDQATPRDDISGAQIPGEGGADGKDISAILSDAAFESILHESHGGDDVSQAGDTPAASERPAGQAGFSGGEHPDQSDAGLHDAGEERKVPFSTVLGSFKKSHAFSEVENGQRDAPVSSPADGVSDPAMADRDRPIIERPEPVRPPSFKDPAPKQRTWWGVTRQTLWLLLVLLLCLVFFQAFWAGEEKNDR